MCSVSPVDELHALGQTLVKINMLIQKKKKYEHLGVAATAAKTRKRFWIVGLHHIAKSVKFKCVFCRQRAQKNEIQMMVNLPPYRLAPFTPPFFYTVVDLFGPIKVKVGRNKTDKYWGILFTCLNVRAVYIDVATDYSTPGILPVLRNSSASGAIHAVCGVTEEVN